MDTKAYFRRIGLPSDTFVTPSETLLRRLQYHHVISVPYENLDILAGRPLAFDIPALYDKIVCRRRGGYCFEVNALFGALLAALGFSVKSYFARYLRGESDIPARRHRVLVAEAEEGAFVCDVGIGEVAPRFPLLLREGVIQEQGSERYRFERDASLGWVLWELYKGEWRRYFSFTEDVAREVDFIQPSFYCEKHPDSPFNKWLMVAIKTANGRKTIDGRVYKEFRDGALVTLEEGCSDARLSALLSEQFGIEGIDVSAPASRSDGNE